MTAPYRFDDAAREVVVTAPLTPRPWINYLTNGRMGAFVSQGAGGLAWCPHPVAGRISRYNFLGLPEDRPGFYVYVREPDGTVWNPSFQPCQTPLDRWECRHGMGYTRFLAERAGLQASLTFFVPPHDDVLLWDLTLTNRRPSDLALFVANYLEFGLFEYYRELVGWLVLRNQVRFLYDPAIPAVKYHYFAHEAELQHPVFLSGSGAPGGFECDRAAFIGRGRDTANPIALERGRLSNTDLPGGGLGIASLAYEVALRGGAATRIVWTLGSAATWEAADALAVTYRDVRAVDEAFRERGALYDGMLERFHAEIPDPAIQSMVNVWSPYGAYVTSFRDRDISSDLPGVSSGIRFRDAMQNAMSVCLLAPRNARERIELLLRHQRADGSTPNAFRPGARGEVHQGEPRCDSPVWSPITVYEYVAETGDTAFLDLELSYLEGTDRGTVYDHLLRGLRQIARDSGDNGLPLLKGRDWDDHLALFTEEGAESVMTAQNWCYAGRLMQEISRQRGNGEDAAWIGEQIVRYTRALNEAAWDGEWYRQVLYRSGRAPLGSRRRRENRIYVNTQSWAVISGTAPPDRARLCMDKLREHLDTDCGIKFLVPPYTGIPEPEDPLVSNGPGLGENGGIFLQANAWAVMAEAMLGRGDLAWDYYRKVAPPILSEHVGLDRYLNEPYMYSSFIICEPDPRRGMANLSWLTGTVNWMTIAAREFILGIRPTLRGLAVQPCLPSAWAGFRARREYCGAVYDIRVTNRRRGAAPRVAVGGTALEGHVLPVLPRGAHATVSIEV